jgi:predicted DNA-binding protein
MESDQKRCKRFSKENYKEYLEEIILLYIEDKFEDENFKLLHDNHGAHKSNYIREWIAENLGDSEDVPVSHPA